jgi:DNA polymerase-3 subunit delta
MAEVEYGKLDGLVRQIDGGDLAPVYLIHGDEYLCKAAFDRLLDALLPGKERSLNYEPLDGAVADMEEVVGRLRTFPLFSGSKVVALHGTRIFYSKDSIDEVARKSMEAFEREDFKAASRYFVGMLSLAGLSFDDAEQRRIEDILTSTSMEGALADKEKRDAWLGGMVAFCHREQVAIPIETGGDQTLSEAILGNIPQRSHLVLISDIVDKRKRLYKTIKQMGVVLDCSVPQGTRKADERVRMAIFSRHAEEALSAEGKKAGSGVVQALYDKTGANLRAFDGEIRKLISFVGDKGCIERDDVTRAVEKTRQDPIYELGNAISERDLSKALIYVDSLLAGDFHPLQILSAVTSQVRRLILAKDLVNALMGGKWDARMNYRKFEQTLWPKAKTMDDGVHVKNMHPYVLYKTLASAGNYTYEELAGALGAMLEADKTLKSTGTTGKLVLERAVVKTCAPSPSVDQELSPELHT